MEVKDTELNYVYTGGEGERNEYGYYKPIVPLNAMSVEIDPSVKEIRNGAFDGYRKIKSITIPFYECDSLYMVELPSTLKQIK
eukprot:8705472-Ditylum_brightwellii.AAC.1